MVAIVFSVADEDDTHSIDTVVFVVAVADTVFDDEVVVADTKDCCCCCCSWY